MCIIPLTIIDGAAVPAFSADEHMAFVRAQHALNSIGWYADAAHLAAVLQRLTQPGCPDPATGCGFCNDCQRATPPTT